MCAIIRVCYQCNMQRRVNSYSVMICQCK